MSGREQLTLLLQHIQADPTRDHTSEDYIKLMSEIVSVFTQPHRNPQVQEDRIAALFFRVGLEQNTPLTTSQRSLGVAKNPQKSGVPPTYYLF